MFHLCMCVCLEKGGWGPEQFTSTEVLLALKVRSENRFTLCTKRFSLTLT